MMPEPMPTFAETEGSATIINFGSDRPWQGQSSHNPFVSNLLSNEFSAHDVKDLVESTMYEVLAQLISDAQGASDENPFDAVYIADLKPDVVTRSDLDRTTLLSAQIQDVSSEIEIEDEWED